MGKRNLSAVQFSKLVDWVRQESDRIIELQPTRTHFRNLVKDELGFDLSEKNIVDVQEATGMSFITKARKPSGQGEIHRNGIDRCLIAVVCNICDELGLERPAKLNQLYGHFCIDKDSKNEVESDDS